MGYTHYWTFKAPKRGEAQKVEKLYQRAIKDCNKVIQAYQSTAIGIERLSGYSAHSTKYGGLCINGKQEYAHEEFTMREHYKQNLDESAWNFCKTAQKPYDVVVTACLAILKHHLKEYFNPSSDGDGIDWEPGVFLAQDVLKKAIQNPIPIEYTVCRTCGR